MDTHPYPKIYPLPHRTNRVRWLVGVRTLALVCLAALSVVAVHFPTALSVGASSPSPSSLSSHAPIGINSNGDFTAANGVTSGSGTASDPYVIAGWDVNVSQSPWHGQYYNGPYTGIGVSDTDAHFVIRNVYIHGLECRCDGATAIDIDFINVTNAVVEDSTLAYSNQAIYVEGSKNLVFTGNSLSNEPVPGVTANVCMEVSGSTDVVVSGNTLAQCPTGGLWVDSTNMLVYHNNFLQGGVDGDLGTGSYLWDNGYPSGGNYWSNYTGQDKCSGPQQNVCTGPDGIGDTPYTFRTWQSITGQDSYPLMKPFTNDPVSINKSFTENSLSITVSGSITIDSNSRNVTGTVSITVVNATSRATLFSNTFSFTHTLSSGTHWLVQSLPTPYETMALSCSLTGCTATKSPDLNQDGRVDILDVAQAALAYSSSKGSPNWNPSADLNGDGQVNILDIAIVAMDYNVQLF